jgi:hypothetical protein
VWEESLRSWIGIVVGALITIPGLGRVVSGRGVLLVNLLIVLGGLVLLVPSVLLKVVVDDEGVRVWPFQTRVRWHDIDWVEAKGAFTGSLQVHRHSVPRPTQLTVQPIGLKRATAVAERLNDQAQRLSAS